MANRLRDKVAIITGAARGQGAVEAALFCQEGARVVATDVLEGPLRDIKDSLRKDGFEVCTLAHDVSREEDWERVVATAESEFGRVDILISNAGIFDIANVEETDRALWEKIIAVDQTGVWLGIKHTAPAMRRSGGGSIVNVGSIFGMVGSGTSAAYHSAKGAVRTLTRTAAVQYAPEGIRVNAILPGIIETPILGGLPAGMDKAIIDATPLGRIGRSEEIAYGALYLASDEASYVTGTELIIDGGYTAR